MNMRGFLPRRLLALGLALLLGMAALPLTASAVTQDGFSYTISDEGATVTGYTGSDGALVIPETLGGQPVVAIGSMALASNADLTSLTIPDSVTVIGMGALRGCPALTTVELGAGVTEIGEKAFLGTSALTSITVSEDNTVFSSVDGVLFDAAETTLLLYPAGRASEQYVVPEQVATIGNTAFFQASKLKTVILSELVTTVGTQAFSLCTALTTVQGGESLAIIDDSAFAYCDALISVEFGEQLVSIGELAFADCRLLEELNVEESLTSIGENAFDGCSSLSLKGPKDSFAHRYATANNIEYIHTALEFPTLPHENIISGDPGDVNGDASINTVDATHILLHTIGKITLNEDQLFAADVNADGVINTLDAARVLLHVVGRISLD